MLDRHLAQKARQSNGSHTEMQGRKFEQAEQELKNAYSRHKTETLANIGSLVKKQTQQAPYDAFVLGLGMYVACYLVNSPLDEADNNVVSLV